MCTVSVLHKGRGRRRGAMPRPTVDSGKAEPRGDRKESGGDIHLSKIGKGFASGEEGWQEVT